MTKRFVEMCRESATSTLVNRHESDGNVVRPGALVVLALLSVTAVLTLVSAQTTAQGVQGAPDQTSAFGRPVQIATSDKGEEIYGQRCAICHDHAHDRIPLRIIIERKSPEGVIAALTTGAMRTMAAGLSQEEIRDVAVYLTGKPLGSEPRPDANLCTAEAVRTAPGSLRLEHMGCNLAQ